MVKVTIYDIRDKSTQVITPHVAKIILFANVVGVLSQDR